MVEMKRQGLESISLGLKITFLFLLEPFLRKKELMAHKQKKWTQIEI